MTRDATSRHRNRDVGPSFLWKTRFFPWYEITNRSRDKIAYFWWESSGKNGCFEPAGSPRPIIIVRLLFSVKKCFIYEAYRFKTNNQIVSIRLRISITWIRILEIARRHRKRKKSIIIRDWVYGWKMDIWNNIMVSKKTLSK